MFYIVNNTTFRCIASHIITSVKEVFYIIIVVVCAFVLRKNSGFVTIGRYGKWYQPTVLRDVAVQDMH